MPDHPYAPEWRRAGHYGARDSGVTFCEATIAAAWNVQGRAERAPFVHEVGKLFGIALPFAPNGTVSGDALCALWLGPGSWLLVAGSGSPLVEFESKRDAINAAGGALFDLSASRVAWEISGPQAATVLAKTCPLDFHARAFAPWTCAQSVLASVNALLMRGADASVFTVFVARSFARDVWRALTESAAQYGYEVGDPAPFGSRAGAIRSG